MASRSAFSFASRSAFSFGFTILIAADFLGVGENAGDSKFGLNSATPARDRSGVDGAAPATATALPPGVNCGAAGFGPRAAEPGSEACCACGENEWNEGVAGVLGACECASEGEVGTVDAAGFGVWIPVDGVEVPEVVNATGAGPPC